MEKKDGRLAVILLAAGDSRRFGSNKLLYELNGKPMCFHILEQIAALPEDMAEKKILVTQYEEIQKEAKKQGFLTVENRNSSLGISHSLHLGMKALEKEWEGQNEGGGDENVDAVMCAVCDQPWLRQDTIQRLIRQWRVCGKGIACLGYHGEPGNPVIFTRKYFPELLALKGDAGGKRVLCRHREDVYICEADPQELQDIDIRKTES